MSWTTRESLSIWERISQINLGDSLPNSSKQTKVCYSKKLKYAKIIPKMRSLGIIFVLFLAVAIQTTLLPFLSIGGVMPNLVLVLVLLIGFGGFDQFGRFAPKLGANLPNLILIILAGLFLDLFSGLPFGVSMLSLLATFFLLTWLGQNVFGQINFGILTALIIIATLVYNLLLLALTKLFQPDFILDWFNYLIYSIPIEIIYNMFVIWLILWIIRGHSPRLRPF